jgi:hypothetical protein
MGGCCEIGDAHMIPYEHCKWTHKLSSHSSLLWLINLLNYYFRPVFQHSLAHVIVFACFRVGCLRGSQN